MENGENKSLQKHQIEEYRSRINRVLDYIEAHLEEELTLEALSRVANFSLYHFHRIFRAFMGEPVFAFVQRLRLEKAARQLIADPRRTVTAVAYDCGFSGSSAFARAFRDYFGMSATDWRKRGISQKSKESESESKTGIIKSNRGKDSKEQSSYIVKKSHHNIRRKRMTKIRALSIDVKDLPERTVAYVRNVGPYRGNSALFEDLFGRLFRWAGPRNLCRFPETQVLAVYHDDPDITREDNLRLSVCITVPDDTKVAGEVGKMRISGGRYAVARFELKESGDYEAAWDHLYAGWLPGSGYQPDDRLPFEHYLNDPKDHPEGKHVVDICVPVKPL